MTILSKIAAMLVHNGGKGNFLVAYADAKTGESFINTSAYNYKEHIEEIVVLANEYTASASECLIGALASYGENFSLNNLVTIKNSKGVGKTYGKGIMQTTYQLISGGAFKLTTARILWPDKKTCIHGVGIIPPEANQTTNSNAINRALEILRD
jgi:carboxyl-terminal processing protease